MREIVFRLQREEPGCLEARAEGWPLAITAGSLEELHHEARDALIDHLGPAHGAYRVRVRRQSQPIPETGSGAVPMHTAKQSGSASGRSDTRASIELGRSARTKALTAQP